MTNVGAPQGPMGSSMPPQGGGGMPKWLIILLVVLLLVILGCCGGFAACNWMCVKAVKTAGEAGAQKAQEIQKQIDEQQKRAEEERRQAEERARGGGVPGAGGGAGLAGGGGGGPAGGGGPTMPEVFGQGRMPSNFPSDVPVMKGLSPTVVSTADLVKGSGAVMLSGKVSRDEVANYYQTELPKQGWKISTNQDVMGQRIMEFTKDTRKATVQVIPQDNGETMVNVVYEKMQ